MSPRILARPVPAWRREKLPWPQAARLILLLAALAWLALGAGVELAWRIL